ncbi:hypothetical protein ASG25_21495 [Rhizobium sp. Leaf384]|uniref:hypothetical protein n=1 Tax=Rhizobium sp. Leaf384 TaxID=1736358 RepID=UPI0007133F9D|nr:hypothetical protein [Rhizobium sp. Leaf384]KQS74050.1 hypothetical protein ASG25_21495 [Rhizobium sp. Leaf384]
MPRAPDNAAAQRSRKDISASSSHRSPVCALLVLVAAIIGFGLLASLAAFLVAIFTGGLV